MLIPGRPVLVHLDENDVVWRVLRRKYEKLTASWLELNCRSGIFRRSFLEAVQRIGIDVVVDDHNEAALRRSGESWIPPEVGHKAESDKKRKNPASPHCLPHAVVLAMNLTTKRHAEINDISDDRCISARCRLDRPGVGVEGHSIIAEVARHRITPEAAAR